MTNTCYLYCKFLEDMITSVTLVSIEVSILSRCKTV